jgi:uncharacterized protein
MRRFFNDGRPIRIEEHRDALQHLLSAQPGLVAAFVFGSYGTADQTPLSDLDLAVLFQPDAEPSLEELQALQASLERVLAQEDVSLTLLNRASPLLQFRVLATGRPLGCWDVPALADFTAIVLSRHADFRLSYARFLAEYDEASRVRYAAG